jgi:hypothetical protein
MEPLEQVLCCCTSMLIYLSAVATCHTRHATNHMWVMQARQAPAPPECGLWRAVGGKPLVPWG